MKRFLVLVLILTLCLVGCKEEIPEKPIEETKTPVENVEVPEIEEPVEVTPTEPEIEEPHEVIPTEPEVEEPVEEIPTEPEIEEPLDENTIVLPEPDENTKIITIDFPSDFPEEPYTEPELVSPEEFDWGKCSFIVEYAPIMHEWYECYPQKAVLKEGIFCLEEGAAEYNKEKGLEVQPQVNIWDGESDINKSHYITHDLENALLKQVANNKGLLFFYTTHKDNYDTWYAFSQEENRIVYEFLLQNDDNWTSMNITQLTDNGNVVLALYKQNKGFKCVNAYLYSLENKNLSYIKSFAYDPIITNDGKYLAYTSPHLDAWDMISATNNLGNMKQGFYIEEIQTGKTIYYPVANGYNLIIE